MRCLTVSSFCYLVSVREPRKKFRRSSYVSHSLVAPFSEIVEQSIGVGTLVGSTVMLLTLPWAAAVFLGRRDVDENGRAASFTKSGKTKPLLTHFSFFTNCITTQNEYGLFFGLFFFGLLKRFLVFPSLPSFSSSFLCPIGLSKFQRLLFIPIKTTVPSTRAHLRLPV